MAIYLLIFKFSLEQFLYVIMESYWMLLCDVKCVPVSKHYVMKLYSEQGVKLHAYYRLTSIELQPLYCL
jgi:hypothetical protein